MKILFITDVSDWSTANTVLDKEIPDVVFLGGDLTSDGFASFWGLTPFIIKEYRERFIDFLLKYKEEIKSTRWGEYFDNILNDVRNGKIENFTFSGWIPVSIPNSNVPPWSEFCHNWAYAGDINMLGSMIFREINSKIWYDFESYIEKDFPQHNYFLKYRQDNHVKLFYDFLRYAGKKTEGVYVVKGDHDNDFYGDYTENEINIIEGCYEISGKIIKIDKLKLLGLGYQETHYLSKLRPLISKYKGQVDMILTHAEEKRVSLVSKINPLIVFRGHYRSGHYKVNDTDFVSAVFPSYSTIEIDNTKKIVIQYVNNEDEENDNIICE